MVNKQSLNAFKTLPNMHRNSRNSEIPINYSQMMNWIQWKSIYQFRGCLRSQQRLNTLQITTH